MYTYVTITFTHVVLRFAATFLYALRRSNSSDGWKLSPYNFCACKYMHVCDKRDLYAWRKRPEYMTKETYIYEKRKSSRHTISAPVNRCVYMTKETYMHDERDFNTWQKRPTYMRKKKSSRHTTASPFFGLRFRSLTRSYVRHDSFIRASWLIHMCDMTHSYVCHGSFICAAWLIHMCDMTHSYVRHDSFICATW